jgi:hypothetical protein
MLTASSSSGPQLCYIQPGINDSISFVLSAPSMRRRPLSVTIIGCTYIVVGCALLTAEVLKFIESRAGTPETDWHNVRDTGFVVASAMLAAVAGAFLLRGSNWARWLCIFWMGAHVIIGALHSLMPLVVHSLLFVVIFYLLASTPASAYFQGTAKDL